MSTVDFKISVSTDNPAGKVLLSLLEGVGTKFFSTPSPKVSALPAQKKPVAVKKQAASPHKTKTRGRPPASPGGDTQVGRVLSHLGQSGAADIDSLTTIVYGAQSPANKGNTRTLLAKLKSKGKVVKLADGAWALPGAVNGAAHTEAAAAE